MTQSRINFPLLIIVLLLAGGLFAIGWQRITLDTDIISSLPHNNPVIDDALHIFRNHPMQDQVTIDVGIDLKDPDRLVICGQAVAALLEESDLFKTVGMADIQAQFPLLADRLIDDMPVLFDSSELESRIAPLLTAEHIEQAIRNRQSELLQMTGIGQASMISRDPLGIKDLALSRLYNLAPSGQARIYKGQLISPDDRHLLLTATPKSTSTDATMARNLSALITDISDTVKARFEKQGLNVKLTPTGAYRAALDNEILIRKDVRNAVLFATLGIAVLLLLAFPRPLIGLLSLLPAVFGTLVAFFLWSLFHSSISIMVLGFGGAIISITVDHGIAYLLFLDRPEGALGKRASHEVWSVGLLATLTTVGAFSALSLSDFSIFRQLGQFAALGIALSFLFVHTLFPRIFPALEGGRRRALPLPRLADRFFSFGSKGAWAALALFLVLALFAKPRFNADISTMNTVSQESMAAEKSIMQTWGNIFNRVFLLTEAETMAELQEKGDQLLTRMATDPTPDLLQTAFLPAMLFPGPEQRQNHLAAWKTFWHPERVQQVSQTLKDAGQRYGFAENAFSAFIQRITVPEARLNPPGIPETFFPLLGIAKSSDGSKFRQFSTLTLPDAYDGKQFFDRYTSSATVFEPGLFSRELGHVMVRTFSKLIVIIAPAVALLLLLFFLDVPLTLISLTPVVFAMVCTLGTMKLMGHALDIPALMLAIIVLGMGIDYSLFLVRSYQRYGRADHPSFTLIRSAVVMTSASTLIGFGVLAFARHSLLQSAGLTSVLGIGFSAIGAFLLLPPLLKRRFESPRRLKTAGKDLRSRLLARYHTMEPYARLFARFKLDLDPLFRELPQMVRFNRPPRILIDIGSGWGVPACWLAETFPDARIFGIEPDAERVRVAQRAIGANGEMTIGLSPDLPPLPAPADGALMLDMMHFLSPEDLKLAFTRIHRALGTEGDLIIRSVMRPNRRWTWVWWLEAIKMNMAGSKTHYRSLDEIMACLTETGFAVTETRSSGKDDDLVWILTRKVG